MNTAYQLTTHRGRFYSWYSLGIFLSSIVLCVITMISTTDIAIAQVSTAPFLTPSIFTPSSKNTRISFTVDSTWVTVHGAVNEVGGEIKFANTADYRTAQGNVIFMVKSFDTQLSMRDSHLREVMNAEKYPSVVFSLEELSGFCSPEELAKKASCAGKIKGSLKICDVTRSIIIPASIAKIHDESGKGHFFLSGEYPLLWRDYHVADPSNFFATLHETVIVMFMVEVPMQ